MKVKAIKKLISDDRANGIEDGSPTVFPGTIGELLGRPKGYIKGNKNELWEVKFPAITWILSEDEFKVIQ